MNYFYVLGNSYLNNTFTEIGLKKIKRTGLISQAKNSLEQCGT